MTFEAKSRIIVTYIKSLTVNGELIIRCNYKTEFIGMIISLYSVIGIFDTWTKSFRSLLDLLLSQDHLELFFLAVRSRCRNNNNPMLVIYCNI